MRNRTATISHDKKMYHLLCEVCNNTTYTIPCCFMYLKPWNFLSFVNATILIVSVFPIQLALTFRRHSIHIINILHVRWNNTYFDQNTTQQTIQTYIMPFACADISAQFIGIVYVISVTDQFFVCRASFSTGHGIHRCYPSTSFPRILFCASICQRTLIQFSVSSLVVII